MRKRGMEYDIVSSRVRSVSSCKCFEIETSRSRLREMRRLRLMCHTHVYTTFMFYPTSQHHLLG